MGGGGGTEKACMSGRRTVSIDAVCSQTDLLHQGGLSWVSIASHVNTTDSKKHLGTNRSLYHSSSRKGSFEVGGGMLEGDEAGKKCTMTGGGQ